MKNNKFTISCQGAGAAISSIEFASYGTPAGNCGSLVKGSCDAEGVDEYIKAACIGKQQCSIYPNSTTFGDPCFGTAKVLEVQTQCSFGSGSTTCAAEFPPSPPSPPAPPGTPVSIAVQWQGEEHRVSTEASLQVVAHRYLMRDSAVHDASFQLLKELKPKHVRYVPWFPYPKLGVCELDPPSGVGTDACVSSWDCTLPDQLMEDVWTAIDGDNSDAIPNFSTPPTWLYSPTSYGYPSDPHKTDYRYNKGRAPAQNLTALGDYYGRLLAWYTKGGVHDECGKYHESGHHFNITIWEVYNEVIHEHAQTVESYTKDFDAIVQGIRRWADPEHRIRFVGINHANIDTQATVQAWAKYFLDPSNHEDGARDALNFIGYHSYPTNGGYTSNPASFAHLFEYVDTFVAEVQGTNELLAGISPATKTMLDECGTLAGKMLPDRSNPLSGPLYWVASGASFVYLYARVAALSGDGIPVVGMSQLMDDNGQEPGVSMIDWNNGKGTARYWALRLLRENCQTGDVFLPTSATGGTAVFAQGLRSSSGECRVLLVNKQWSTAEVTLTGAAGCTAQVVDATSNEDPPRSMDCDSDGRIELDAYATAVVTLPTCPSEDMQI